MKEAFGGLSANPYNSELRLMSSPAQNRLNH